MPVYPKAGVSLDVDSSDWDAAYKTVLREAGNLDSLAPTVKVGVNDADLKTAIGLAADLDTSTSLKINVDDGELSAANDKLDDIATIGAIDLAINVAGTAKGFFESLGRFSGVAGLMELDSALALVEARTGKMIPQAEELINKLYTNGWGESRTQIAGVVAQAAQLGLEGDELEAAVLSTLQVVSVTGGDATETLNKLDTASKAMGITFTETADLYIAGFQNGDDRADDLLDTLNEYGTTFSNFRLSAEGAMAFLDSGLELGVYNSDVLADSVRELGIRLASIGTDENVAKAFTDLDALSDIDLAGLLEGYEAGTVLGDEMLQGVIDALADVEENDPALATTLGAALVGTQLEDMGISVFTKLTTDADAAFGVIEGRAETAGNAISDTLGVTVDTFLRGVEQMAVDFLSSDAVDLDGKIDVLKKQLQDAGATLAAGGSIGDALEIGFHIEGVDTALANIERIFGNLAIGLLQVVALIQGIQGVDNTGTTGEIARLGQAQLTFDLKVANPDEVEALIKTALGRGVDAAGIGEAFLVSINEAFTSGDFGQGVSIMDAAVEQMIANGASPETISTFTDRFTTQLGAAFDASIEEGDFDVAKKIADSQNDPTAYTDALKGKFGFDAAAFDSMAADFATGMEAAIAAETPTPDMLWADLWKVPDEVTTSITTFGTDVDTAMTNAALASSLASEGMLASLAAMSDGVVTADEEIALALTGNTVTASFQAVEDTAVETMAGVIAAVQSVFPTVLQLDALLRAVASAAATVQQSVNTTIAGAGAAAGGGGSTTNINVTNTNNVQSNAQAVANGYQLGAQIRGFA